ncbi:MAG: endonuclease domain-containing protein [Brevundimonas sp.]|jgi:very-short-patch-repair endonuclease|uniref:Endonuclease domain-containing protein n=2 Tax=Caulobacteraceae TaxID=76892 RepID=A0ABY4SQ43_9CAUL|nr:endonuclease domain-containing protein [Brevundimonas albigilva]PZU59021.1 MAG: endonuclease domain-containing protein [Brevundimonas sp.]UQV19401.1 endonuclease domain-containing protein [Brevundimonas albigilva]URI15697.1 endonuclease domain-containing protein [Brevundimonas albigilva]
MRKTMTPPEARMWVNLKRLRAQGYHFRRQAPFRGYFLDFVCFERRLVIEVDGQHHGEEAQALHDARRDATLATEGFLTLRFDNPSIRDHIGDVMDHVLRTLQARPTRSLRDHPPHEGEGE